MVLVEVLVPRMAFKAQKSDRRATLRPYAMQVFRTGSEVINILAVAVKIHELEVVIGVEECVCFFLDSSIGQAEGTQAHVRFVCGQLSVFVPWIRVKTIPTIAHPKRFVDDKS